MTTDLLNTEGEPGARSAGAAERAVVSARSSPAARTKSRWNGKKAAMTGTQAVIPTRGSVGQTPSFTGNSNFR